jgi:hypothetical protein
MTPRVEGASRTDLDRHLGSCAACSRFERDLGLARELLQAHRADHQPDSHFARRVTANLPGDTELLGWAAFRLLPAALALLLALSLWAWSSTPGPRTLVETSPTDDLLAWAIEEDAP